MSLVARQQGILAILRTRERREGEMTEGRDCSRAASAGTPPLARAGHPDGAPMQLDQLPGDRQAQPEPAERSRGGALLREAIEHVGQEVRGDADARSSMCEFTRCSSTLIRPPRGVNLIALPLMILLRSSMKIA